MRFELPEEIIRRGENLRQYILHGGDKNTGRIWQIAAAKKVGGGFMERARRSTRSMSTRTSQIHPTHTLQTHSTE